MQDTLITHPHCTKISHDRSRRHLQLSPTEVESLQQTKRSPADGRAQNRRAHTGWETEESRPRLSPPHLHAHCGSCAFSIERGETRNLSRQKMSEKNNKTYALDYINNSPRNTLVVTFLKGELHNVVLCMS